MPNFLYEITNNFDGETFQETGSLRWADIMARSGYTVVIIDVVYDLSQFPSLGV